MFLDKPTKEILGQAEKLKERGNDFLRQNKNLEAVELYTKSIELIPENAVYYGNRSQARLNLQHFEGALKDATKAIELDELYTKAYYRKAIANRGLGNYQTALEEFHQLQNHHPKDENIKENIQECKNLSDLLGNIS